VLNVRKFPQFTVKLQRVIVVPLQEVSKLWMIEVSRDRARAFHVLAIRAPQEDIRRQICSATFVILQRVNALFYLLGF
jgi:hypothetical protein